MRYLPLIFIALFCESASASDFSGCKGTKIGKTSGDVVDVSSELSSAEKRMNEICEKNFPPVLEKIKSKVSSCAEGVKGPNTRTAGGVNQFVYGVEKNLQESCKLMKERMKSAAALCAKRQAIRSSVNKNADLQVAAAAKDPSQLETLKRNLGVYKDAEKQYGDIGGHTKMMAIQLYQSLPDYNKNANLGGDGPTKGCQSLNLEDPAKQAERRAGRESKDTKDPKLDEAIESAQRQIKSLAQGNANSQACEAVAAKDGALAKLAKVKKENFWPNGRRAARAIQLLAFNDCKSQEEFAAKSAELEGEIAKISGDIQPTVAKKVEDQERYVQGDVIPPGKKVGDPKVSSDTKSEARFIPQEPPPAGNKVGDLKADTGAQKGVVTAVQSMDEAARLAKIEEENIRRVELAATGGYFTEIPKAKTDVAPVKTVVAPAKPKCEWYEWFDRLMGYCQK
jgi:hypothetical protein